MKLTDRVPLQATDNTTRIRVPGGWIAMVAGIWALVALYVAQAFLPKNVIHLPGQEKTHDIAFVIAPQGWAFFTKSAKDSEYVPFRRQDGAWGDVRLGPHARASNAFGLDRASRSQGIEGALLLHEKDLVWHPCGDATSAADCLQQAAVTKRLKNRSPSPTVCGRSAMVEMKPVPWAWRDLLPGTHTPVRAAVWDVEC
ncbi:SdpA family antimicrobial peptide system protein [Streptomyces lichenis]|uniref:SdpA family antimicrobial peptide system protein n=1 Tax=Streptomyces lichenis TaxID=2306967 RepID=A0ABT0IJ20_9ACTN|nr:SdpA family antimicrobial peptide system protein [Streptomyces lichenis]MCK8681326.1 SdpA family antimicrobial peptide system protein [Streptomyces lichenis]